MRGHGIATEAERTRAFEEHRQEIQGRLPKGPFEFASDLNFTNFRPDEKDNPVRRRFKLALERDSRYSVASGPYLQLFAMSQALRAIYDGGGQIQDGE